MSTAGPSKKFIRAAMISGLLGAAGLVIVAEPVKAQDNGTDNGTDAGSTNGTDNGSDNGTDNGTDAGATTGSTDSAPTTGGSTTGGTDSTTGHLAATGGSAATPLMLGGVAVAMALAGRRLLASRA
jgi:hypothetical protein